MGSIEFRNSASERGLGNQAWATAEEMAELSCGQEEGDLMWGSGVGVSVLPHPDFRSRRNTNAIILGGSGSGKSELFKYNLAAHHEGVNAIVTDTKGDLERTLADGYRADGYDVVTLNTVDPSQEGCFDILRCIKSENEIPVVARMIAESVSKDRESEHGENSSFWRATEHLTLECLIGFLFALDQQGALGLSRACTFPNLLSLFSLFQVFEDGVQGKSPLDRIFDMAATGEVRSWQDDRVITTVDPAAFRWSVEKYRNLKKAADRTLKSVVISVQALLNPFQSECVARFLSGDDVDLETFDSKKKIVFVQMSDTSGAYAFLGRLVTRALIHFLFRQADERPSGRLERQTLFFLDEFCTLGCIEDADRLLSTARSRGVGVLMCVQSLSQLEATYGKAKAEVLLDNADSFVYLGSGSNPATAEYVSRLCGEYAIASHRVGDEGAVASINLPVISSTQILSLPRDRAIVKISGKRPFLAEKLRLVDHPNYDRFVTPRQA